MIKFYIIQYLVFIAVGLFTGAIVHLFTGIPAYYQSVLTFVVLGFILERTS